MTIIRLVLLLASACAAFCSCTTTLYVSAQDDIEAVWKGKSYAEIVQINGAPHRETSDGNDGVILVYEALNTYSHTYANNYPGPWYGGWYGSTTYSTEVHNEVDYIHFYIGKDKLCYGVKSNLMKENGKKVNTGATVAASVGGAVALGLLIWLIAR